MAATDQALREDRLACSAISFWEVAMLAERRRISLRQPLSAWRRELLESGLGEIPVAGRIGLPAIYHSPNPFPWMSETMDLSKEKNFFETRVTEYQTGGTLSWD